MAFVITVTQQKGGAGKTMLAANLAAAWAPNLRVAVLDIDPQRSLSRWHAMRAGNARALGPITLSEVAGWRLAAELDRLRQKHDIVVIDSPPQIDTEAKLAVRGADLVLVPVQPSLPDLWAAEGTLKLAALERRTAWIVLNRAPAGGALRARVSAAIDAGQAVCCSSVIGNRIGFANAFAIGLGVTEQAPRSLGGQEIAALLAEIAGYAGL